LTQTLKFVLVKALFYPINMNRPYHLLANLAMLTGAACGRTETLDNTTPLAETPANPAEITQDANAINEFSTKFTKRCFTVIAQNGCVPDSGSFYKPINPDINQLHNYSSQFTWEARTASPAGQEQTVCSCTLRPNPSDDWDCTLQTGIIFGTETGQLQLRAREKLEAFQTTKKQATQYPPTYNSRTSNGYIAARETLLMLTREGRTRCGQYKDLHRDK